MTVGGYSPAPPAVRRVTTAERSRCRLPRPRNPYLVGGDGTEPLEDGGNVLLAGLAHGAGRQAEGARREGYEGRRSLPLPPARASGTPHAAAAGSAPPRRRPGSARPLEPGRARPAVAGVARGGVMLASWPVRRLPVTLEMSCSAASALSVGHVNRLAGGSGTRV